MENFDFESTDFALGDSGLYLLRNGYNYKTIDYQEIENATIKRDVEINNRFLALVLGIILVCFAIKQSIYVVQLFNDPNVHRIYIESIVLPILPGFVGIYLIWNATRKKPVLIIKENKRLHKLRLKQFYKVGKAKDLLDYLKSKLFEKLVIKDDI